MFITAPPTSRRPFMVLPLGWAALVLVLTLTPSDEMPETPHWELLAFDTAAHAAVFVVLAALSVFSLRRQLQWPALRRWAYSFVLLTNIAFGALIEFLQMTMDLGRHGEWSDLLSDSLGVVAGLAGMWLLRRWWR